MEIKNITMRLIQKDTLRAICSVNFENLFVVHNIRLIEGKEGMFLSFPAKIKNDGTFSDIAHPINSAFRKELTDATIKKYKEEQQK